MLKQLLLPPLQILNLELESLNASYSNARMRSLLALIMIGIFVSATNAASSGVGCAHPEESVTTQLLSNLPIIGRRLLATKTQWKPCNEVEGKRITGEFLKQIPNVGVYRACCVECKRAPTCVGWSFSRQNKVCKLFAQGDSFTQLKSTGYLSGMLDYKL